MRCVARNDSLRVSTLAMRVLRRGAVGMLDVLRIRDYRLILAGQLPSNTGDWLLLVAAPFFVFELTGSTTATGLTLTAEAASGSPTPRSASRPRSAGSLPAVRRPHGADPPLPAAGPHKSTGLRRAGAAAIAVPGRPTRGTRSFRPQCGPADLDRGRRSLLHGRRDPHRAARALPRRRPERGSPEPRRALRDARPRLRARRPGPT